MPAKNPRLTITLEPSLAAQLRRLSALTGNSQSALIAELLDGSAPIFERLIRVLEAANQAKESIRGRVAVDLHEAQGRVEQQLGLVMETFDDATRPLLDDAERINRRARGGQAQRTPRAESKGSQPLSNRGVRSRGKVPKTSTESRG